MVDLCLVFKWYFNGGVKTGLKDPVHGPNVKYLNSSPSHTTLPFEYRTPKLSGIQVFGIQSITVVWNLNGLSWSNL